MSRAAIATLAFVAALIVLALVVSSRTVVQDIESTTATPSTSTSSASAETAEVEPGFIYGRITTVDGTTHEGRLRWGRDQEAFWGEYFNGAKDDNPWVAYAPSEQRPRERKSIEIFGFEFGGPDRSRNFDRLFMARFGDIARIDADFQDVRVTLKSGTIVVLDRFAAGDIDDGVRIWDAKRGVVDLDGREIRTIEFRPTAPLVDAPDRLHGAVRTRQGTFSGFVQWNQEDSVGEDELDGRTPDGERRFRYDAVRSIARNSRDSAMVTLRDGKEVVLSNTSDVGNRNRGIYVDDRRYGRVLISWDAFEHVEFGAGGSGPAYGDFTPGRPLAGSVTTRDGRRLAGRLVYDFDESETTETFDVQSEGVDYTIPFGLIASIVPRGGEGGTAHLARVVLHDGKELQLERTGDLAERNAGMLIFVGGRERPEFVAWTDVERVDLDRPQAVTGEKD